MKRNDRIDLQPRSQILLHIILLVLARAPAIAHSRYTKHTKSCFCQKRNHEKIETAAATDDNDKPFTTRKHFILKAMHTDRRIHAHHGEPFVCDNDKRTSRHGATELMRMSAFRISRHLWNRRLFAQIVLVKFFGFFVRSERSRNNITL